MVLIHGWGLHAGVWADLRARLKDARTTVIDLPGHGRSLGVPFPNRLELLVERLHPMMPVSATWLGWSLGGLVALVMALKYPARVRRLILVASTPRFVCAPDWPCALDAAVLTRFTCQFATDGATALQRFLTLQTQGDVNRRIVRARLGAVLAGHAPQPAALKAGLDLLVGCDLRSAAKHMACLVEVILGEHDHLVPSTCGRSIQALFPSARLTIMEDTGHAPFLSQPERFCAELRSWLD